MLPRDLGSVCRPLTDIAPFTGYASPGYAASLAEFGTPRQLPRSGGWLLERRIPGSDLRDGIGCYPMFSCREWRALESDLAEIDDLVSLALVFDPFGADNLEALQRSFAARFVPFKHHFVADLSCPPEATVSRHHRYYARKALNHVTVERCDEPVRFLDEWLGLYDHLIARHQLRGVKAFSEAAFNEQLRLPGMVMLRAIHHGRTVSAHLWMRQGDVVHSHLAASNADGYELMAAYALHWYAWHTFAPSARWLNFGGGSGLSAANSGLTQFKRGWATDLRAAYFCGRIFDQRQYAALVGTSGADGTSYFPAYRSGEFG